MKKSAKPNGWRSDRQPSGFDNKKAVWGMFKNKKAFFRSMIASFVPFVLVVVIAFSFLNKTFRMLEERNISVLQIQMENMLNELESELAMSRQVANQMCIDSTLSREKMLEYGRLTVSGIERLGIYGYRMNLNPQIFLTYVPQQLATVRGTSSCDVYARATLGLTLESLELWNRAIESQESITSTVLEGNHGSKYLLLLYYYPETRYVEEKRIGFLFDRAQMDSILVNAMRNINSVAILTWGDQVVSYISDSLDSPDDEAALIQKLQNGQVDEGHTLITSQSEYYDMKLTVSLNNSVLIGELVEEEVKMVIIGIASILCLSLFIWVYQRYRYRVLNEIRQLAVRGRPDLSNGSGADEYEIIRMVLERNLSELKTQRDNLETFRAEAKRQMSWLLLCSPPPENVDISKLMDGYGMSCEGDYFCVMEFLLEERLDENSVSLDQVPDVLLHCIVREDIGYSLVLGLAFRENDNDHQKRLAIAQNVLESLFEDGIQCRAVSCGLIYEQISQIYSSRQEARSVLRTHAMYEATGKTVLFFDQMTHLSRSISHDTEDLLVQFHDALCHEDGISASELLHQLMEGTQKESRQIYIRYKLVDTLINVIREMEISPDQMDDLMKLIYLDPPEFERKLGRLISQLFVKIEKKNVADFQILDYIESKFCDSEISLRSVADHFQISERSVSRIIKKAINKTYKEYLNHLRMEKACKLLIKEVGYYDVSSFNRLFKQSFQMTPMEFRSERKQ